MTGAQMITKCENMVDDVINADYALQLVNDAINEVEASHDWEQLKKEHSFTLTSGATIDTNFSLPSDFSHAIAMYDDGFVPYTLIPFEERRKRRDENFAYVIDFVNSNIQFTGTQSGSKTMYFYYIGYSTDIATSGTWSFPERFHSIVPYKMAEIYYASDAGEKARSWDDRWSNQFERKMEDMRTWDTKMKLRARRRTTFNQYNPKAITSFGGKAF